MQDRNPYAAPQTNVARGDGAEEYGDIRIFSARGRIGRARFIGYSFGLSILIGILIAIAAGVAALADPILATIVIVTGYLAIVVVQILLTIQRSHDMNVTGWLTLIALIPLAALVFWFVPGTRGENKYGPRPPPNTTGVYVLACLLPFVMIVGILAAIAIPAYQDYTIRAQISEGLNLAAAAKAAVADAYTRTGSAPADRLDAGLSADAADSAGRYVAGVDVAGGMILVSYGANANSLIAGRVLTLQPYVLRDGTVVWRCGDAAPPGGAVAMDSEFAYTGTTDIESAYLPSACRP